MFWPGLGKGLTGLYTGVEVSFPKRLFSIYMGLCKVCSSWKRLMGSSSHSPRLVAVAYD